MKRDIHIGIDLDNTIVNYDAAFAAVACELGLLPPGCGVVSKEAVKAAVRQRAGEQAWMYLQGQVYGRFIDRATPYPGFDTFLHAAQARDLRIFVVSHKTQTGHFDPLHVDLRRAARNWMEQYGFIGIDGSGLPASRVYFEDTQADKIGRILSLECHIFVDDLPAVLHHPALPDALERIWFAGSQPAANGCGLRPYRDWRTVLDTILSRL